MEAKELDAKDFLLQLKPRLGLLTIGFGSYANAEDVGIFYTDELSIKLSEDYTKYALREITDLTIDDKKRIAEFDALYREIPTHFTIREFHKNTLEIMKFIKAYNENPFEIDGAYEDEINIVINESGFDITLWKSKSKQSVMLFHNTRALFFEVYSPIPIKRFTLNSWSMDDKGLFVQYDGLDLYKNEQTDNLGCEWDFAIQPELKNVIAHFMQVALNSRR